MKSSKIVWSIVIIIIVVLGAWYFMSANREKNEAYPSTKAGLNGSQNQTNTGQMSVIPVVNVSPNPKLGNYLVASNGMTL